MNRTLKQKLAALYSAPPPAGKAAFLKRYRRRELGWWELLAVQAGYIHRWVWALSGVLFLVIACCAVGADRETIWITSALTPFLALLAMTENGKSRIWQMEELELSCRIPLRSVVLTRMLILGLFHLGLLGLLTPMLAIWGELGAASAGVYLLTPYLLTAALGMEAARRIPGRECLPVCMTAAGLVSVLVALPKTVSLDLYKPELLPGWLAALAMLAAATAVELAMNVKETETLKWN